jgi:hypothetical protein
MAAKDLTPEEHGRVAEFLKEYETLCRKYSIVISACGCCNSPWLSVQSFKPEEIEESINHLATEIL